MKPVKEKREKAEISTESLWSLIDPHQVGRLGIAGTAKETVPVFGQLRSSFSTVNWEGRAGVQCKYHWSGRTEENKIPATKSSASEAGRCPGPPLT